MKHSGIHPSKFNSRVQNQIAGVLYPKAHETVPHRPLSHTEPQRDSSPALDRLAEGKETGLRRIAVSFTGYRVNPLDPDNFAGSVKDLLDGLRKAGLIHGDEWKRIRLRTEQVQVRHYRDERTLIEIE